MNQNWGPGAIEKAVGEPVFWHPSVALRSKCL
jgi:hypothetical protein